MAGRINDDDIAAVRDRAKIDEIIGSYVTLRRSGGSMVGLCPFHDEKSPSFNVNPSRGFYHCFGCLEGGDVIAFVEKIENLNFVEAVERLADRVGIQLRYTEESGPRPEPGQRVRLLEAHRQAAEFFVDQLTKPDALTARQFLAQRGFDRDAAEKFGVGYAPRGGRELLQHLRSKGFRDKELVAGGLAREAGFDVFQGRLLWPIRDTGGSVVGFGARKLFDDDRMSAKYINTSETPLYKKSQVLYGLDMARQQISKKSQAVIVEGYTDVMAAHLSGVETAVASCGTAFGDDHAKMLRRLMGNHDAFRGEVIFTFDGDAAGQNAAIKVFKGDQNFVTQTYVAVEPTGLDPCDLRLQHGDAAVRELVARRVPLYRFVMTNILSQHDLDRADGRLSALREAAPLVASIRDSSMVTGYARELAGLLGMDPEEVRREVLRVASGAGRQRQTADRQTADRGREHEPPLEEKPQRTPQHTLPNPRDRSLSVERETAKLLIQHPRLFGDVWDGITEDDFTHPAYAAVFLRIAKAGVSEGVNSNDWVQQVQTIEDDPQISSLVVELAVEPIYQQGDVTVRYATAFSAKLQLLTAMRRVNDLKSKLQRTNPVDEPTRYNQMFSELVVLEQTRARLQAKSIGTQA